jgi:hypothetical protein
MGGGRGEKEKVATKMTISPVRGKKKKTVYLPKQNQKKKKKQEHPFL